jgi:hypothetical protein
MLSWDIAATGERWTAINARLKEVLSTYSWVRPLKTVYIVKVASQEQRQELKAAFVDVVKSTSERVNFVMSPPMEGGSYSGWLPKPLWEKIAKRTKS